MNLAQLFDWIEKIGKQHKLNYKVCRFFEKGLLHAIGVEEKTRTLALQPFNNGIVKLQSNEEGESISKIAISYTFSEASFEILMQQLQKRYPALNPTQIKHPVRSEKFLTLTIDISNECFEKELLPEIETSIGILSNDLFTKWKEILKVREIANSVIKKQSKEASQFKSLFAGTNRQCLQANARPNSIQLLSIFRVDNSTLNTQDQKDAPPVKPQK